MPMDAGKSTHIVAGKVKGRAIPSEEDVPGWSSWKSTNGEMHLVSSCIFRPPLANTIA